MQQRPEHFRINPYSHLAQGLVFAGLGNMPGSTHYHDSSLYGKHGTLTNMDPATDWVWDSTLKRWKLGFNGSNQYVTVSPSGKKNVPEPFTLVAWIRKVNDYQTAPILQSHSSWGKIDSVGLRSIYDSGYHGYIVLNKYVSGYDSTIMVAGANTTGKWYHVAGVFESSTKRELYLDGCLIGSNTTSISNQATEGISLGAKTTLMGTQSKHKGNVADPMIFDRALSVAEIQQLADPSNAMLSGLLLPPRRRLWAVSGGIADIIEGRVCWGHDTDVEEENILDFEDEWTGTAEIVNAGVDDTEKLVLEDGEYMESVKVVETGVKTVTLQVNKYGEGDEDVVIKYRHAADSASCTEASWNVYTEPFESLGYVQVRLEAPDV